MRPLLPLKQLASDRTTVSAVIASIVERHSEQLEQLDPRGHPAGSPRRVTLASYMPLELANRVRAAAEATATSRSEIVAAAIAAELT